jgi:hypothetical protein
MTLRLDKRIRNNWGVNANYTFSRLMDNQFGESNTYSNRNQAALDNYELDREWSYSLLDVPHRVNVNGTFVVPLEPDTNGFPAGWANALLGGWSVTAAARFQNGFPISVWQSSNNSGLLGSSQRPNIVPGVALATSGSLEERLNTWINASAFTRPRRSRSATRRARWGTSARQGSATWTSASRRCSRWMDGASRCAQTS